MQLLSRLSIQSKFIVILLLVSLSAIGVVSYSSYLTAKQAATEAADRQLLGLRATKSNLIQVMLGNYRDQITSFSTSRTAMESLRTFTTAVEDLGKQPITPEETGSVEKFYRETFLPGLIKGMDTRPQLNMVLPADAAGQRLQALYVAGNTSPYLKGQLFESAADASTYTEAHRRFHPIFAQVAKRVGLEDILLIEGDTLRVVYTFQKTAELGTSLATGPYANSNLAVAVRNMMKAGDRAAFEMADFELYRPNLGAPAAFFCAPHF